MASQRGDEKGSDPERRPFLSGTVLERIHRTYMATKGANKSRFDGPVIPSTNRLDKTDADSLFILMHIYDCFHLACYETEIQVAALPPDEADMYTRLQLLLVEAAEQTELPTLDPLSSRETSREPFVVTFREISKMINMIKDRIAQLEKEYKEERNGVTKERFTKICARICEIRCHLEALPRRMTVDARLIREAMQQSDANEALKRLTVQQSTMDLFGVTSDVVFQRMTSLHKE